MSKYDKPKIDYSPREINSDKFGIPPFFKYYCEYHDVPFPDEETYNEHMAKYHPGKPKSQFGDFKPFEERNPRDYYSADEQEEIDEFLNDLDEIEDGLNDIDAIIDDRLADLKVPYDPRKNKLLAAAHKCPRCGNPNANDELTYPDFVKKALSQKQDEENYLKETQGDPFVNTPEDILKKRNAEVKQSINSMMNQVIITIVRTVLNLVYTILKPLTTVPILKEIPKLFKRKKDAVRSKSTSDDFTDFNIFDGDDFNLDTDFDISGNVDTKGFTPGQISNSRQQKSACVFHYQVWNDTAEEMVPPKKAPLLGMKKTNDAARTIVDQGRDSAALHVPDGYQYEGPEKGSTGTTPKIVLKVFKSKINPVLRSITPGEKSINCDEPEEEKIEKTKKESDKKEGEKKDKKRKSKFKKIVNEETKRYIKKAKAVLNSWMNSEEIMCCFIYNLGTLLSKIRPFDKLTQKLIKTQMAYIGTLKGILGFYRNLKNAEYKKSVKLLRNMILALVQGLVQSMIELYINLLSGYIKDYIKEWSDMAKNYTGQGARFRRYCVPFEDLMILIPNMFRDISLRLNALLASKWNGLKDLSDDLNNKTDEVELIFKLDKYIEMLGNMLSYLKFWIECLEQDENIGALADISSKLDAVGENNIKNSLQNARKASTIYKSQEEDQVKSDQEINNENLAEFVNEFNNNTEPDRNSPWGYTGMQVLLTNFVGIDPEKLNNILNQDKYKECRCKNGFAPDEIENIKGIFKI